jgi:hypothetical protein
VLLYYSCLSGDGPDGHLPSLIYSFGPVSARIRRVIQFSVLLGRTHGRFSNFSFGGRTNLYEIAVDLVSGADFRCVLHYFSSFTRLGGSWGQVWPESGPKVEF